MAMRRMADARILINGSFYAAQEVEWESEVDRLDMSNTEAIPANAILSAGLNGTGGPCRSALPDIPQARGTIRNMTWAEELSPYAAPFFVGAGVYFALTIFPSGINVAAVLGPLNVLCLKCNHRGVVGQGGQPVTLSWCTDGEYFVEVQ